MIPLVSAHPQQRIINMMRYHCEECHKLVILKDEEMVDAIMYLGVTCKDCYDKKYTVKVKEIKKEII